MDWGFLILLTMETNDISFIHCHRFGQVLYRLNLPPCSSSNFFIEFKFDFVKARKKECKTAVYNPSSWIQITTNDTEEKNPNSICTMVIKHREIMDSSVVVECNVSDSYRYEKVMFFFTCTTIKIYSIWISFISYLYKYN